MTEEQIHPLRTDLQPGVSWQVFEAIYFSIENCWYSEVCILFPAILIFHSFIISQENIWDLFVCWGGGRFWPKMGNRALMIIAGVQRLE